MLHRIGPATTALLAFAALAATALPASAQAFGPGPAGIPVGSSMAGARIGGAPPPQNNRRIPNADVFGDEAEERAFGRDYDDSYLRPKVGTFPRDGVTERRAIEGRSSLNGLGAGVFAREGPSAIGGSAVTRPSSKGRAKIVFTKPQRAR
ncbi:hypothetical protein ASG43_10260 [Aureimonas sp. Leaf454]|uniref:hypothetical protein n=1 Tax=Aureimonas sp. Leaf454 TaxID=1736381 RepID=UPI0006FDE74A|nr:hypothetical protein [Aureimonas sp. Leaf454]KQT47479.1 hypothetical protein ASG43_10260 [Aureimonas sp. Leaf454]